MTIATGRGEAWAARKSQVQIGPRGEDRSATGRAVEVGPEAWDRLLDRFRGTSDKTEHAFVASELGRIHEARVAARDVQRAEVRAASKPKAERRLDDAPGDASGPIPAPVANFAKSVAKATGKKPTHVKRFLKLGRAFTDEQLRSLDAKGVHQDMREAIAGVVDAGQRAAIVGLIAKGTGPAEAMGRVTGQAEFRTPGGLVVSTASVRERDLDDDDWIATHCRDVYNRLPSEAKPGFKAEVVVYRRTRAALVAFARKAIKPARQDQGGATSIKGGVLASLLSGLIEVEHPRLWQPCGACASTRSRAGSRMRKAAAAICPECSGRGYRVTFARADVAKGGAVEPEST